MRLTVALSCGYPRVTGKSSYRNDLRDIDEREKNALKGKVSTMVGRVWQLLLEVYLIVPCIWDNFYSTHQKRSPYLNFPQNVMNQAPVLSIAIDDSNSLPKVEADSQKHDGNAPNH